MKARSVIKYISQIADSKFGRIIVFTGARQTGKTTIARELFPEFEYLSIEDPISVAEYKKLTASQWKLMYPKAILDEVQKEPILIESIKSVYDQFPEVHYILLGSSQLLLLSKVRESLAGRCVIVDLFPLTLPEMQTDNFDQQIIHSCFQKLLTEPDAPVEFLPSFIMDKRMAEKQRAWEYYCKFGGYPALTDSSLTDEERYIWLDQYVRTYLERDVRDLTSFRDLQPFIKLQHATALLTSTVVNASSLANHAGLNVKTVQRYIQYMDLSYQTITLPAWSRNQTKKLVKAPKIHFLDNGVLQAVLQKRGGMTGAEFESLIVSEIYKQAKTLQITAKFYHLRIQGGREIDLLIETPKGYFAFEIKITDKVNKNDIRHFNNLEEILDKPLIHSLVLTNDPSTITFADKITAVNAAMFLG
ncbi:MAG: AAA family ATPase [Bacteroidales bacterium]|nr:AAA family ATPase [Bacteroidales bacterium]MDD2426193.1 AAA family ATPase [Bacteroidales bacterium]MDD3990326.1 AAA family ATPase [Bacteroidales bacterium]